MEQLKNRLTIGLFVITLLVCVVIFNQFKPEPEQPKGGLGSAVFQATTTDSNTATTRTIKAGWGTFSGISIHNAGTATISFYDATTTDVTARTGNKATSTITIAQFPATPTVGSYPFNVSFTDGLLMVIGSGEQATTSIMYE